MRKTLLFLWLLNGLLVHAQTDTSITTMIDEMDSKVTAKPAVKIFNAQKLINANTVEMLRKGHFEFKVQHNFGDIAGKNGGIHNYFGLDNATDIKIAFQLALSDKLNLVAARTRGGQATGGDVRELYELGAKYQFLQQREQDPSHPVSITMYANAVVSAMRNLKLVDAENSFKDFGDRGSSLIQLMVAKKIGGISLQFNPTFVHTNYVESGDQNNMFAVGGAVRLPIVKKFALIADYFHPFRERKTIDALRAKKNLNLYDVLGLGFEMLTPGHVFHFNVTNTYYLLENRFIPRTFSTFGKGQYRWGFTITRDFVVFRDKRK